MANQYVAILEETKHAFELMEPGHESLESLCSEALEESVTDADRKAWFSETNSHMTRNIKAMQTAVERVLGKSYYVQIEPAGSPHSFNVLKSA